ncbi:MAG: hypothetical protein ABI840_03745 [bacterium]
MVNSNLLQMIGRLDVAEFREFGEYVRSPFFNKNESVIKLYDYIKIHYPDFSEMNFEKKYVYKKIFPKVEYDDAFMRKLMFNMAKLTEDYLAYKKFSEDKFGYYNYLLPQLDKKGLQKLFYKKLNIMEQEFDKLKIMDSEYYRIRNTIENFRSYMILKNSSFVITKDKPDSVLNSRAESLINYFLIKITEEYRFQFNFKKMVSVDFSSTFYKDIINYLRENESIHNIPLLSLYYYSLLLITEKGRSNFDKVKNLLLNEGESYGYYDKYSSYALLTNFANDEYHSGKKEYLKERHELHKLILKNNLYSGLGEGEYFNDVLFKIIVTVGLLMKEIEWTEKFTEDYIEKLDPEKKDNILRFNNARINFAKGNFERSLEDLSMITSVHHFHYKPSIKSLSLMIYIEKGWIDQAYDAIDTYRHFLTYDKMLPDFQKEKNSNFIKFCKEILKLKSRNGKEKINDVKFDLMNSENILEKEWLMEKIDELGKAI